MRGTRARARRAGLCAPRRRAARGLFYRMHPRSSLPLCRRAVTAASPSAGGYGLSVLFACLPKGARPGPYLSSRSSGWLWFHCRPDGGCGSAQLAQPVLTWLLTLTPFSPRLVFLGVHCLFSTWCLSFILWIRPLVARQAHQKVTGSASCELVLPGAACAVVASTITCARSSYRVQSWP